MRCSCCRDCITPEAFKNQFDLLGLLCCFESLSGSGLLLVAALTFEHLESSAKIVKLYKYDPWF